MFRILNEAGLEPDLPPDMAITVDKVNPLFNDSDEFIQDMGYPATAPPTDQNKKFFNHADLVESPNGDYNFPVTCYGDTTPFNVGNINFAVRPDGFEFNLEPNYAALNSLVKNIRVTEVRTNDYIPATANISDFEALMLDTVKYPDKYPFIFFPLHNTGKGETGIGAGGDFINHFDIGSQTFKAANPTGESVHTDTWGQTPFFKLSYILKQLLQYLGYTAAGSFFTDPKTKNICVYTRVSSSGWAIFPSMRYMPNMSVTDFLKFLRNRLHLSIDLDNAAGIATVETFETISDGEAYMDLTPYLIAGMEQEIPEGKGYSVTLKSDEQDANFKVSTDDNDTYPPIYRLVAGDASTEVELDCSTLKGINLGYPDIGIIGAKYVSANQTMTNPNLWVSQVIGGRSWLGLPPDMHPTDNDDPTTINNWPLRLVKYTGWTQLTDGAYYPCSEPLDLGAADEEWYRFLNDSKRLIIPVSMPVSKLAKFSVTKKYAISTTGRNYTELIIEKISYDIKPNAGRAEAKIYARTLNYDINTRVSTTGVGPNAPSSPYTFGFVKAYFDNSIHGLTQLDYQVVATGAGIGHNYYDTTPVTSPTNAKGAGGTPAAIIVKSESGFDPYHMTAQIRIVRGNPKYLQHLGVTTPFTWSADGYWYVDIDLGYGLGQEMLDDYWIYCGP